MWEVFVYINPVCSYCLKVEQSIIDFTRKHEIETQYHFVTNFNMETINEYIQLQGYKLCDLKQRAKATQEVEEAARLYQAASCQGNKKARNFLMNLQEQINTYQHPFDDETIKKAIVNSGLDYKSIMAEKDSYCVELGIKRDKQLSKEMQIEKAPTIVIFDNEHPEKPGIMINDFGSKTSEETINHNLTAMLESTMPQTKPTYINNSTVVSIDQFRR